MICKNCNKEFEDIITHKRYCDKLYHYKNNVIDMYENGLSIKKISDELKISRTRVMSFLEGKIRTKSESGNSIKKWIKTYEKLGI